TLTTTYRAPNATLELGVINVFIRDKNSNILAIKNYPDLADALIKLMEEARSQAKLLGLILDRLDHLSLDVSQLKTNLDDISEFKKPKVAFPSMLPSIPTYCPGSSAAFKLIKQTDEFLGQHGTLSKEQLTEYAQVLEQTAYFQLFSLDIAYQACKQLLDCRERLRAAVDDGEVAATGVLIRNLQVSKVPKPTLVDDGSDMEVGPIVPADDVSAAIEATLQD
ncbi:hypothetical protein C0992_005335, partial [Termitomyces sp. T32_za158]